MRLQPEDGVILIGRKVVQNHCDIGLQFAVMFREVIVCSEPGFVLVKLAEVLASVDSMAE